MHLIAGNFRVGSEQSDKDKRAISVLEETVDESTAQPKSSVIYEVHIPSYD